MNEPCPHCGSNAGFEQRERPPHIGLYCRACDRWLKWIPRSQADQSEPPQQTPALCTHSGEIERIIHALNGVERQLKIITRAMINGVEH